jgi:NADH-quinone oxidoreductase E subunit
VTTIAPASQQPDTFAFSADNLAAAKAFVAKYPDAYQASAVLPLLDLAQRQNDGWLPRAALEYVADFLGMPPIRVFEVATFYTMLNLAPVGRHHVQVCTNISCWLRGADAVVETCRNTLGIGMGETTDDGQFTLSEVECLGACVNAPMMQINDDYYEDLDAGSTQVILATLQDGGVPKSGSQIGRKTCEPLGGLTSLTDDAKTAGKAAGIKKKPRAGKGKGA